MTGTAVKMTTPVYTTEKELRLLITATANARTRIENRAPDPELIERWIKHRIEVARENKILMTNQQYSDHKTGRGFQKGDAARYIGNERSEHCKDGETRVRKNGQTGCITSVVIDGNTDIVTFRPYNYPDEAELVVREGTPGYIDLERMRYDQILWIDLS